MIIATLSPTYAIHSIKITCGDIAGGVTVVVIDPVGGTTLCTVWDGPGKIHLEHER